jgi:hypothetical protein
LFVLRIYRLYYVLRSVLGTIVCTVYIHRLYYVLRSVLGTIVCTMYYCRIVILKLVSGDWLGVWDCNRYIQFNFILGAKIYAFDREDRVSGMCDGFAQ